MTNKKEKKRNEIQRSRRSWGFGKVKETADANNQNAKEMGFHCAVLNRIGENSVKKLDAREGNKQPGD